MRWTSPRSIKETFDPPKDYRYPLHGPGLTLPAGPSESLPGSQVTKTAHSPCVAIHHGECQFLDITWETSPRRRRPCPGVGAEGSAGERRVVGVALGAAAVERVAGSAR